MLTGEFENHLGLVTEGQHVYILPDIRCHQQLYIVLIH